jgi:hypothetical protein
MSVALTLALLLAADDATATATVEPSRVRVGEKVALTLAFDARADEEARFDHAPRFDALVALLDRRFVASDGTRPARLELEFVACGVGELELGPYTLRVQRADGEERLVDAPLAKLVVAPSWTSAETPPFPEWRRTPPPPKVETHSRARWWWVGGSTAFALVALWIGRRLAARRAIAKAVAEPPIAPGPPLDDLLVPIPDDAEARRAWCVAAHERLRAAFAVRSAAAAWPWTREEIVRAGGFGAWRADESSAWSETLARLDQGRFAATPAPLEGDFGRAIASRLA